MIMWRMATPKATAARADRKQTTPVGLDMQPGWDFQLDMIAGHDLVELGMSEP